MTARYHLGIDLGGTKIAVGLADPAKRLVVKKARLEDYPKKTKKQLLESLFKAINPFLNEDLKKIGIGFAGSVKYDGKIISSPNLPKELSGFNLKKYLSAKLKKEVTVINDADAFLLGEQKINELKDSVAIALTFGTGIGGAVGVDNRIIRHSLGRSSDPGHMLISQEGFKCGCGNTGCWETVASSQGLVNFYFQDTRKKKGAREIMEEFAEQDAAARKAYDKTGHYLTVGLYNIVKIVPCDYLIAGGGMSKVLPLASSLKKVKKMLKYRDKDIKLIISKDTENSTILGSILA